VPFKFAIGQLHAAPRASIPPAQAARPGGHGHPSIDGLMCHPTALNSETTDYTNGGMVIMHSPLPAGRVVVQYVRTENNTRATAADGRLRREWFPTVLGGDTSLMVGAATARATPS
jgi:hypothetical protein